MTEYRHTQPGTMLLAIMGAVVLVEAAIVLATVSAATFANESGASVAVAVAVALPVTILLFALGYAFRSMTVHIHDGRLEWWFGSGFPRYSKRLSEIADVRIWPARGFALGIHWTRDGWLYNVSGMKGVQVALIDGKGFILGTDEPETLESALRAALDESGVKEESA